MIPGSANPLLLKSAAAAGGLQIERSLRFNSADSANLSRTPGTAGNRRTWTWAAWVKRSVLGSAQAFFGLFFASNDASQINIQFDATDNIRFNLWSETVLRTTQVFRDCSAWYHFVIAFDAPQGTASNRLKIYVNGAEITTFSTDNRSSLLSNQDYAVNAAQAHYIGYNNVSSLYFNGYLTNIHFIDGQQLTPSSFTETDATTGQLIPKTYSGSYGTNGFNLLFADNSSNTASTLGKDTSGLSNNWTPNNFSVTAGVGNDSLVDSPTNYGTDTGVGGTVRGNYATLNPLAKGGDIQAPTNGNLQVTSSGSGYGLILGTIGVLTGKWYWEVTTTSAHCATGIATNQANLASYGGADAYSWVWVSYSGGSNKRNNGSQSSYGSILANGDVVGIAFDADTGTLTCYKNGVSQGDAYTGIAAGTYLPVLGDETSGANIDLTANFGQRAFAYTAPSGFKALCTQNLPAPLVTKSNTVMDVVTYTGTGAALTPTSSLGFNPDWIWIKSRSAATDHALYDVVRGAQARLESNTTDAEVTTDGGVTAFNSAGFTLGTLAQVNTSAATYVAWAWDAGTSTVSNTAGSITSQVRANPTAGFSVVTFTGNGSTSATVGHGLGVAPRLIIEKSRTASFDGSWWVHHADMGSGTLTLNSTDAVRTNFPSGWINNSPTSTTFSFTAGSGGTVNNVNYSGDAYVAYCFAPVVGYSSFGSYTGNGSTDGPFVYTGFRPRWILLKASSTTGAWILHDTARTTYNVMGNELRPDDTTAEYAVDRFDLLSNGFKVRSSNATLNTSSAAYIYMAFAESPFNYSRAR